MMLIIDWYSISYHRPVSGFPARAPEARPRSTHDALSARTCHVVVTLSVLTAPSP